MQKARDDRDIRRNTEQQAYNESNVECSNSLREQRVDASLELARWSWRAVYGGKANQHVWSRIKQHQHQLRVSHQPSNTSHTPAYRSFIFRFALRSAKLSYANRVQIFALFRTIFQFMYLGCFIERYPPLLNNEYQKQILRHSSNLQ